MRKLLILIAITATVLSAYGQERIYRKDGSSVKVKIVKIDSNYYYFTHKHKGVKVNSLIDRDEVLNVGTKSDKRQQKLNKMDPLYVADSPDNYPAVQKDTIKKTRNRTTVLSGTFGFNYLKDERNTNNYSKETSIDLSPTLSFLLKDNHEIGFGLGMDYTISKNTSTTSNTETSTESVTIDQSFYFGFYYRYYFLDRKLKPYIHFNDFLGKGEYKTENSDPNNYDYIGLSVSLGATYKLSNCFEFDFKVSAFEAVNYSTYYKEYGSNNTREYIVVKSIFDTQSVQLGVRYLF